MASKVEFFVEMTCESCVESIKKCLNRETDIKEVDIQLNNRTVIVQTTLPINDVQKLLQSTGRKAVLKGFASSLAAVAVIEAGDSQIQGVIRFMKNDEITNTCIIDGTVDGLQSVPHDLCIYECGDLSNGCESVGSLYKPESVDGKKFNSTLVTFHPKANGRASFRITSDLVLSDLIGRSAVIVKENEKKMACGIIARSAGLFQNSKTICACDGVSIWDENEKPKAFF